VADEAADARMAEMVMAFALRANGEIRVGSSPTSCKNFFELFLMTEMSLYIWMLF
jgi:hypothetical protein